MFPSSPLYFPFFCSSLVKAAEGILVEEDAVVSKLLAGTNFLAALVADLLYLLVMLSVYCFLYVFI